jgi:VWFA-related protein
LGKHTSMKSFLFQTTLFAACAWCALAQSHVVTLNVVATDKQGQPVTDLKAEDLRVTDDGKPQPIVMFRVNDGRRPAGAALGPHEYANRAPGAKLGATIIVFDLLNGDFSDREYMVLTLVKALANVEDPASVYLYILTNNGTLYPIHPLSEHGEQATAQDQNWTTQAKPLLDAAIQKIYGFRPADDRDIGVRVVTTFQVLSELGGQMAALPGRKDVVWITDGFPLQTNFGGLCRNIVVFNVTAPCTGNFVDFTPVVRYLSGKLDAVGVSMYPVDEWNVDGGDRMLVKETLDGFADMTGGRSYASGGAKAAIPDALQAMRFGYTVAYQPAAKNWDGKFHKIRVTTARKGIQLQSEQGYIATPPVDETGSLLQTAAGSNADLSAIGLRATATPGASPHTLHVQLRIDPSSVTIVQQNGHYTGQLAALYAGVATDGLKQLAKPSSLKFDWTAQQYDAASKDGIAVAEDLPTPENIRQVRIVIVDTGSNQVGTLTVPVS